MKVVLLVCQGALSFAVGLSPNALQAQVPQLQLSHPDGVVLDPFKSIRGIRELDDGRVLVSDGLGHTLVIADFDHGTKDTLGWSQSRPEKYGQPDLLFPLSLDSTLLADFGGGCLRVIDSDFQFRETYPILTGLNGPERLAMRVPRGVDASGRVYYEGLGSSDRTGRRTADSVAILRWDRGTSLVDTVAYVRISSVSIGVRDGWAVSRDGWVAVVRADGYYVEWFSPDGDVRMGPANDHRPIEVGRPEMELWLERQRRNEVFVSLSSENGKWESSLSRGNPDARHSPHVDDHEWSRYLPAFDAVGVWVALNGTVWVRRSGEDDSGSRYDVFDAEGVLVRRVTLPCGRTIIGFGDDVVYAARMGDSPELWLERFRI